MCVSSRHWRHLWSHTGSCPVRLYVRSGTSSAYRTVYEPSVRGIGWARQPKPIELPDSHRSAPFAKWVRGRANEGDRAMAPASVWYDVFENLSATAKSRDVRSRLV